MTWRVPIVRLQKHSASQAVIKNTIATILSVLPRSQVASQTELKILRPRLSRTPASLRKDWQRLDGLHLVT